MSESQLEIHITTKNRWQELQFTLTQLRLQEGYEHARIVVFDDGSTDNTSNLLAVYFPEVERLRNEKSRGLIHCRNYMLNNCRAEFAVSLDDDAHFVDKSVFKYIHKGFENEQVGVLAFRIFWGKQAPENTIHSDVPERVQSFVGCGHAWRLSVWQQIENYPAWWKFYGEEDFAAYQLFRRNIYVQYEPDVFVQHRVDVKSRKNNSDYQQRLRRAWRAGWFLMLLFYPLSAFFRSFLYSVSAQFKNRIFKSEPQAIKPMLLAISDFLLAIPRLLKNRKPLTKQEFVEFQRLPSAKIYWTPNS